MNTNKKTTLHGNFMIIDQLGVLITGDHGIGKSELSLALMDLGHQFISDDSVDLCCRDNKIIGTCPDVIDKFMIIAGIGVINLEKLFTPEAFACEHALQLIIHLVDPRDMPAIEDPLNPISKSEKILGIEIPEIIFPASAAKSLPLLIETLARNYHLKLNGYDTSVEFTKRHRQASGTTHD
ncbi:HPr kinase/phosphorylase [Candidiatus Paracoxiella cheracis]|uniref:HPr kinase/phosphorylase n=1 Tax=Candidiatus Paracoxiella cheracis TaxID=3405120 RepID=UPI003BF4C801